MATKVETNVVECPECGRRNRVPTTADGAPQCGNCHAPLPWITDADDDTFARAVEQSHIPVVVDLWATWCRPCGSISSALEQIARDLAGRIKLVKVDVDKSPRTAERFNVRAVPTLLVMKGSEVVATRAGAAPVATLRAWLDAALERASLLST
ncbi:thioredoxin family protein [Actinopolymorpha pittospori]